MIRSIIPKTDLKLPFRHRVLLCSSNSQTSAQLSGKVEADGLRYRSDIADD